ncbi:MAG: hypothetical protein ACJAVI_002448, partial [Candidatus Azotimanducaceae bacterium]
MFVWPKRINEKRTREVPTIELEGKAEN